MKVLESLPVEPTSPRAAKQHANQDLTASLQQLTPGQAKRKMRCGTKLAVGQTAPLRPRKPCWANQHKQSCINCANIKIKGIKWWPGFKPISYHHNGLKPILNSKLGKGR